MGHMVLRVVKGNATGTELRVDGDVLLGRSAGDPGNLGNDATLSRRHARIRKTPEGEVRLEDLGSHNGTRVNGRRVDVPLALNPGDRIELGETTLELILVGDRPTPQMTRISPLPAPSLNPPPASEVPAAQAPVAGAPAQPARPDEVASDLPAGRGSEEPSQPTRIGRVPAELGGGAGGGEQATRLRRAPQEAGGEAAAREQATRLGRVSPAPAPEVGPAAAPTRLGRVPVEPPAPEVGPAAQPTRLGRAPVEPPAGGGGSEAQPTRLGRVPVEPSPDAGVESPARRPRWWRRLLRGSR